MAKIPTADTLGYTRIGNVQQVVQIDKAAFAAPGRALQNAAGVVGKIGEQLAEEQRDADDYEVQKRFIDFDLKQDAAFDEAKRNAPEDARDFATGVRKNYDEAARGFFGSVPDRLKPKFDLQLARRGGQYEDRARTWETEARDTYHSNDLGKRLVDLNNLSATKPDGYKENIARGITLIDAAPIPAAKKMALRTKFAGEAEAYALRGRDAALKVREESADITPAEREAIAKERMAIQRDLLGGPEPLDAEVNQETRAKPFSQPAESKAPRSAVPISVRLETGETNPLKGVSNISGDSKGSRSYGNFGLNSQGSAQAFVRNYGKDLGLSGEPGTAAFDKSWKAAARANPEALHKAEMAWFDAEIAPRVSRDLTKIGVAEDVAQDGRVQSYFADRLVQYGPASIGKHATRISEAFDASGGNAEAFLRELSEADRGSLEQDFPSALDSGVYSEKGHDNRVYGRLNLALAGGVGGERNEPEQPAYTGPYRHLTAEQRLDLAGLFKTSSRRSMEGAREQLKRSLDDDVESIRHTGQTTSPDVEMAKRVLEENQIKTYELRREEAQMEFTAMRDLPSLPEAELQERLKSIDPAPGEKGYAMKQRVFEKVNRAINGEEGVRNLRERDPARSVEGLPEVQSALEAASNAPDDPAAIQKLAGARLDAQAKVGVSEGLRSPITKAEARVLTAPLKGLEGKALTAAVVDWKNDLQTRYGPYARVVAINAIDYAITRDKDLARVAESQINNLLKGQSPSAELVRRAEFIAEANRATQAFGGEFVGEPRRQYGAGAFKPGAVPSGDASFKPLNPPPPASMPAQETPFQAYAPSPSLPSPASPMPASPPRQPSPGAIELLIANPALADKFNERYGAGSAERILNGQEQK